MARRKQKAALPIVVIIVIVLVGLFVDLPPSVLNLLPPDIAQLLQRDQGPTLGTVDTSALPSTAGTFSTAKGWLYEKVYYDHRQTLYCDCPYTADRNVLLAECGMQNLASIKRAQRIEAEHIMPAYDFGRQRACWQKHKTVCGTEGSGRDCCQDKDPVFNAMHNDLHNLAPTVGYVNGQRSNYRWGMIEGEPSQFGRCDMKIDDSIDRAEPPDHAKGDVARAYFYLAQTYGIQISDQQQQLFTAWNRLDPPDDWEQERNRRIARAQGNSNPFIEHYQP